MRGRRGAANCLHEPLICCPNEILSRRIEDAVICRKTYWFFRLRCSNEMDLCSTGGGGGLQRPIPPLPMSMSAYKQIFGRKNLHQLFYCLHVFLCQKPAFCLQPGVFSIYFQIQLIVHEISHCKNDSNHVPMRGETKSSGSDTFF